MNQYVSLPALICFVGAAVLGFVLCLFLTDGTAGTLGWITVPQACVVFACWPHLCRKLHHTVSPVVLMFLSAPLYAAGIRLGGTGAGEAAMSFVLMYILFLYVSFLLRIEEARGLPPGAWYIPVSTVLVAGPIVVYYISVEFLMRPLPFVAGISPVAALRDAVYLRTGCAAWAGVLAVTAVIGFLTGVPREER